MDRAPKSIPKLGSLTSMYRTVISVPMIYRVKKRFSETSVEKIPSEMEVAPRYNC